MARTEEETQAAADRFSRWSTREGGILHAYLDRDDQSMLMLASGRTDGVSAPKQQHFYGCTLCQAVGRDLLAALRQ